MRNDVCPKCGKQRPEDEVECAACLLILALGTDPGTEAPVKQGAVELDDPQ